MAHSSKKTALLLAGTAAICARRRHDACERRAAHRTGLAQPCPHRRASTNLQARPAADLSLCVHPSAPPRRLEHLFRLRALRQGRLRGPSAAAGLPADRTGRRACAPGPRNRGSSLPLPTPMFRLYARVLGLLGPQMRLGWLLALANVALAAAALAEPVLFGRIIDALAGAQGQGGALDWPRLTPLVAAWVGFGLFLIVCGALVSLYADKLAHKRRQAVLSDYFEHVLQLPLSFHSATHSGRLMKVMLTGTDTLWWLWLGFFREHLAAIVSIAVLAAARALSQLAARPPAHRTVAHLPRAHRVRAAQDRSHAEIGRALLLRPRRARLGHARQCGAGAELHPRRGRGARIARSGRAPARARKCRCSPGGRWSPP